jgi:putative ABC transport system substrate-binding protein
MVETLKKSIPNTVKILMAQTDAANDVSKATLSLMGKVEAVYVPADNTVVAQINTVLKITHEHRIPVFASEAGSVKQGALAALAYDQYEVGYLSGRMAGQILHGKNPGTLDVIKPAHASLWMNTQTAQQLSIQIPETIAKKAELIN